MSLREDDRHAASPRLERDELDWILTRLQTGVVVLDRDLRVRFFNLAAQRVFHPHRLRVGVPLPELDLDISMAAMLARVFDHGAVVGQEVHHADGRAFVVDATMPQGRPLLLRIDDVSARARRLRAGQDFIVNAAHEYLSPLTAIAGAAHVLQDGAKDVPEVRDRFLKHIVDGTNRLIAISRALLVLARAEAGVEPPRFELVALRPLLEQVAARDARGVSVSCPDDAAVLADADLLREVLANLVLNAKKHSGTEVDLIVGTIERQRMSIDVVNHGARILEEDLATVTDRFVSGDGRDSGGYGIGLSIAARAAGVLGGTFAVASDDARTRMRLVLPSARLIPT